MDIHRKYLDLVCEICGCSYLQQVRLYKKALWKNRCRKHRRNIKTCPDCGIEISRVSNKCRKHAVIKKYTNCINCGIKIKPSSIRCISCHNIKQNKGLSTERTKFNNSEGWNIIRIKCFERDNYTCQICKNRGGFLNAHHIKTYKNYPEERLNLDNLITLCYKCHLDLHYNRKENENNNSLLG